MSDQWNIQCTQLSTSDTVTWLSAWHAIDSYKTVKTQTYF